MTDARQGLPLLALTVHAREVRSETREDFGRAASLVVGDPRAILLRTCHRVELYVVEEPRPIDEPASGPSALQLPELPAGGRRLEGIEVARHVFRLAAGLESVVVGEDQILHQLRECLSERHLAQVERHVAADTRTHRPTTAEDEALILHPLLHRLLQLAIHLGRDVRSRRESRPRSLADVALEQLVSQRGSLGGRPVLIVGAGRMARLAAQAAAREGSRVLVANRSHDRAVALARAVGGTAVPYGADASLPPADAILVALAGRWALSARARDALLATATPIVDLSSPSALDAELREALGARHTSVDDLARGPGEEPRRRLRHRLERALAETEAAFVRWAHARHAVPTIQALSDQAEMRRVEELERLFRRADLPDHQRELVEQMSRRLVAGLLHSPLVMLREDTEGDLERAARSLFSL